MPRSVAEAVKDPQFLAAPVPQQMAYLSAIDPEFKLGKPEQQLAYLNHITGKPAPTTSENSAEKANTWKPNAGFTPGNMAGQAWEGLKQMGGAAVGAAKDALDPRIPVIQGPDSLLHKYVTGPAEVEQQKARTAKTPLESLGHSAAEAIPIVGPWAASLGEQAGTGDVGGAVAKGAAQAAATEAIPRVGEAARATREFVGEKIHTPEGELKPIAKKAAQSAGVLAGGAAGGATTIPGAGLGGAYLGREYGPSLLNKAFPKPTPPEMPVISPAPFELTPPPSEREAPIQQPLPMGQPETVGPFESPKPRASMGKLEDLIAHEGAGMPRLEPNVPIGQQPRSVGAAAPTPMQIPPRAGVIPNMPLGSRVATPISEEFGPMAKRQGEMPRILTEEPARQMGGGPLRPDVSLREQPKTMEAPVRSEQSRLEEKYPDKADRQMVHANGEEMVDAIGHDPETMKAVHDLTNPDVRQAMINSGEDMGQQMINNRKASGDISRQDAFRKLLGKGLTPREIVKLAKQPIEDAVSK